MSRSPSRLERMFQWLASQRLPVLVLAVGVVAAAAVVVPRMPLQLLPEVRYAHVRVVGDYPGRTAKVIEESVNQPLEEAFAGIERLVRMESRSGDGRSYIELFFQPGHDLDRARQDVMQGVARARGVIPAEFPDPRVFSVGTTELPVIQIAFASSRHSPFELRQRLRSSILPRLRTVDGVEAAFVAREDNRELLVELDAEKMEAAGLSPTAVEATLATALAPPVDAAVRTVDFEGVGTLASADWTADALAGLALAGAVGEVPVTLESIADVRESPSVQTLRTRLDGKPAVLVTVHRTPSANSLRMARQVRDAVERGLRAPELADVDADFLFDDSIVTAGAVRSVLIAAAAGALLATGLIALALRRRRGLAAVACIVLAGLASAVLLLHAGGQSLNLLTMAALLLSVGLGLDYAIIFFDRMERLASSAESDKVEGVSPAARAAAGVAWPLAGAVVTTLAAILPFLLVEGLVAMLFRPLVLTVAAAAVTTFLFAMLLLPAMASENGDSSAGRRQMPDRAISKPRGAWWSSALALGFAALMAGALVVGPRWLPFEVLPVVDDGFIEARMNHPVGITMDQLDGVTRRVEDVFRDVPGTRSVFSTVGGYFREGSPSFRPGTSNFMIRIDPTKAWGSAEWAAEARQAVAALDIPGLRLSVTPPRIRGVQTRLSDADVIVVLARTDGDLLALGDDERTALEVMSGIEGLTDVSRVRGGVSPRWRITPDREALAAHGVDESTLRLQFEYALEGRILRQRMQNGEPLSLRLRHARRESAPDRVQGLRLAAADGTFVHLGDVADFGLAEEPTHIERREQQRVVRVSALLDPAGPPPGQVLADLEEALAVAGWCAETSWWTEGEVQAMEETRRTFITALGLALAMVFAWLLIQFRRFSFSLATLLVLPLGAGGAFLLLGLLSRPIDAMVLAGLLIAVGVTANNAILVLAEGDTRSGKSALPLANRLRLAGRLRLRPVALTTASTVLGVAPLIAGGERVFGLLQPLAISLTGALLASVALSCFVLPRIAGWLARGSAATE